MVASSLPGETDLWTATEVAALMGVDPKTVLRWVKTGMWPHRPGGDVGFAFTPQGHYRFHHDAVQRAVTGQV